MHSAAKVTFPLVLNGNAFVGMSNSSTAGALMAKASASSLPPPGCVPNASFSNWSGACAASTARSDHFLTLSVVWLLVMNAPLTIT